MVSSHDLRPRTHGDRVLIPLAVPNLCGHEGRYLQECVETGFVSSVGPFVTRFEALVSQAASATHAVATSSGTTALHAALTTVGVGRDDLVILPSLTFIASANAISHCGATPWLLDVDEESWTLDARQLARALEQETELREGRRVHRDSGRRVGAVMPVYTLGMPAEIDALVGIARSHGLPLVADAAAALGARYRGRDLGDCGVDLTVFSFNGNKTVTAGGGGAIVGNDESLCALARHLTTTAKSADDYTHDRVGFNYRMTNLQAAVGCAQLEQLEPFVAAKRRIARTYREAFAGLAGVHSFPDPDWGEGACWLSGIATLPARARDLVPGLRDDGIDARPFWKPIHLQPAYRDAPRSTLPVSDRWWEHILTLPCSTQLSEAEQVSVIASVRRLLA